VKARKVSTEEKKVKKKGSKQVQNIHLHFCTAAYGSVGSARIVEVMQKKSLQSTQITDTSQ